MMKRSYVPPQVQMRHNVNIPTIMAASGESESTNKKIEVSDDPVGDDEEFWFRSKHNSVWDDSEAFK